MTLNTVEEVLRKVELDEIELCLNLLKLHKPNLINNQTYRQIAENISNEYNIVCKESEIRLLHEPTIEEMSLDLEIYFQALGF